MKSKSKKATVISEDVKSKKEVVTGSVGVASVEHDCNGENTNVDGPDPNVPNGFERGLEAEDILGATEMDGQILFLIKWYNMLYSKGSCSQSNVYLIWCPSNVDIVGTSRECPD